ncbi:MAG: hypothetical protein IJ305_08355 [Oscillospiraceae bacterium]|nr:hypothetical protein [Oscillospiraceae bacterium]
MRIDFHSHILPEMDDGAQSTAESIELLKILADAKVDKVVLTPHFYRDDENIASFLKRRAEAYEKLVRAINDTDDSLHLPELVLGAEVLFTPSLSADPDFEKLCIGSTDYILLELPFIKFHDNFFSDYIKFLNRCDKKIILAHIERYLRFGNSVKDLYRLIEAGDITCQLNCSSIAKAGFFDMKKLKALIDDGVVSAIGTDTHNLTSRPPLYKKAEKLIRKKCGNSAFEQICTDSEKLVCDAQI